MEEPKRHRIIPHPALVEAVLSVIAKAGIDLNAEAADKDPESVSSMNFMLSSVPLNASMKYAAGGRPHARLSADNLKRNYVRSFARWAENIDDEPAARAVSDFGSEYYLRGVKPPDDETATSRLAIEAGLIAKHDVLGRYLKDLAQVLLDDCLADLSAKNDGPAVS